MTKLILLLVFAGASASVPWTSNPKLPGYPNFFGGWQSWTDCSTEYKDEKDCFEACMTEYNCTDHIDAAHYNEPGGVHPGKNLPLWSKTACQCARRCECKLGRCENQNNCPFCGRPPCMAQKRNVRRTDYNE